MPTTTLAVLETLAPPIPRPTRGEDRFLIRGINWAVYEKLQEIFGDDGPRMSYLDGMVELMSPHIIHEQPKKRLARMIETMTEELNIPVNSLGSTTFKRQSVERGAEPDECYYLTNIDRLVGQKRGDLDLLPPPDLVIEVEITSALLDKLAIYSGLGVPEIWRHDGERLSVLVLGEDGHYVESKTSRAFPFLPLDGFVAQLQAYDPLRETPWIKSFRVWVREVVAPLYHP